MHRAWPAVAPGRRVYCQGFDRDCPAPDAPDDTKTLISSGFGSPAGLNELCKQLVVRSQRRKVIPSRTGLHRRNSSANGGRYLAVMLGSVGQI